MQSVSDLFTATAANFEDTMTSHSGNAGFRVPEYQRTYDWDTEEIKRLIEDCLTGFYYLKDKNESYTFLGTIILVAEKSERTFDGTSLSIVDGQQRLTTLILLCCALIEELFLRQGDVQHLEKPIANWIEEEIKLICDRLFACVIGQLRSRGNTASFPRIVRYDKDHRAFGFANAEYRSVVANFLMDFAKAYEQDEPTFPLIKEKEANKEEKQHFQNYKYIKDQVHLGIYGGHDTDTKSNDLDLEHEQVKQEYFLNKGFRDLFEKSDMFDEKEKNRAISAIAEKSNSSGLIRIILFSYYFMKSVILTRVETRNEDSAFDIFDSLNTTGQPLTALETFKPRVIRFENENQRYSGSESEMHFERLEGNLNDIYHETEKRQKETKELLVTFALYMEGHKLAMNLAAQRAYLRKKFEEAKDLNLKRQIVQALADIVEFKQTYWNRDTIRGLDSIHSNETSDLLKLCCTFISEMKTSLAIPIMTRYWVQYREDKNEQAFTDAVKALTAFLVLRRSVTGNTGRIDSDFRKMMGKLCIGLDDSNPPLSLDDLQKMLREYLAASRIEVIDKRTWVSKVCEVPLAYHSRPLCRFLLFAASHNAKSDSNNPGLLTREGIRKSDELNFFNFGKWQDDKYATVEHIAPDSNSGGWDKKIYVQPSTRHTIGNIILLPQKENSSVGNAPWAKKKIFYRALIAKTEKERNEQFEKAEKVGLTFKKQTKDLVKKQGRLHMLDPLAEVNNWTKSKIQKRTKNTLEFAWDEIASWLNY